MKIFTLRSERRSWCARIVAALSLLTVLCAPGHAQTVEYIHTDSLGSPIAITDAARNVIERSEYAPYGWLLTPSAKDGPGFTGHVLDAVTDLSYMQQRYYDSALGKFLSVDPVTAYGNPVMAFNRYWYANNNPYKFSDPDGRQSLTAWPVQNHYQVNKADKPGEGAGEFGTRRMTQNGPSTHSGIDIQAPVGTPVLAAGPGTVLKIVPNPSSTYGNQVVIDHGDGVYTESAHLNKIDVNPGDEVVAGEIIGTVGRTGNTPSAGDSHLHLEVRQNSPAPRSAGGTVVDPAKKLPPPPPPSRQIVPIIDFPRQ